MSRKLLAGTIVLILVALLPFMLGDPEPEVLDARSRAGVVGGFATLSDGVTHYVLSGPPEGEVVVLVHGFAAYSFVWDPLAAALNRAGYRVLRYDLYGRGYSDRPAADHDADLYDRQLHELLDALEIQRPFRLVGLSMGGAIAAVFAHRHRAELQQLALFAPAGLPAPRPTLMRIVGIPVLGEWLMRLQSDGSMVTQATAQLLLPESKARFAEPFAKQLPFAGYRHALLSALRHYPLFDLDDTYRRIGTGDLPVFVAWGEDDTILPVSGVDELRARVRRIEAHVLDRAGHMVIFEEAERVAPPLVGFFRR